MKLFPIHSFVLASLSIAACGGTERDSSGLEASVPTQAAAESKLSVSAGSPWQGQVVETSAVSFSGRSGAPAGSAIAVTATDGAMGRHSCSATVDSRQTWTCAQRLPDGGYTWTAQVVPGGPISPGVDFVVHTCGVQAPLLDRLPSPGSDAKPVLTGTVSRSLLRRGWILEVSDNGHEICVVEHLTSTQWFCALSQRLPDGPHVFSADVSYGENGVDSSPDSNPSLYVVKTSIAPPTVAPVPSPTSTVRPTFAGKGEPGATVTVSESGSTLCQALVAADGAWSCTAGSRLADGLHTAAVSQRDTAGNTSTSVSVSFVVDTHVPRAPVLDPVRSPTSDPRPAFKGTGEPGDRVSVVDAYAHLICSSLVDGAGAFGCAPASPLDDGDYLVLAFQQTPLGIQSGPSAAQALSVRTLAAPLLDAPRSPTRDPAPDLGGHARPGALVAVMLGETSVCRARADASGTWICKPGSPLADGLYLIMAQETDGRGHSSPPSATRALVVDTTPPAAPALDNPASPTRKRRPTLSGTAEAASSIAVSDAGSGARLCDATANAAGAFSCLPGADLPLGTSRVTAVATDLAGNTSPPATPVSVIVSDTVPAPPTIESPAPGAEVEESQPTIAGRTSPGTSVQVTLDGVAYVAQVDPDGRWNLVPPQALSLGAHAVFATATDPLFNVSDKASSRFSIIEGGVARGGCASGGVPGPLLAVLALLVVWPRRRKRALASGFAVALAAAALPWAAGAQTPSVDVSLFRPASGGDGFAAVEGARPPLPGEAPLELHVWGDYAVEPLVFVSQSGARQVLVSSRTGSIFGVQAHLLGPLSFAAQVPMTLAERGDLSGLPGAARGPSSLLAGFGDLRLTPRLALLRQEWAGVDLATQVSLEIPTARAQTLTDDGRVRAEGLVALGRRVAEVAQGHLEVLGNVFVRLRPSRQLLDVKSGNEAGLRAGAGWFPTFARPRPYLPTRLYLELEGRSFLRAGFAAGSAPAEWRLGTTLCPARNLAVDLGGGGALSNGVGAPKARFLFGLSWSPSSCGQGSAPVSAERALVSAAGASAPAPALASPPPAAAAQAPVLAAEVPQATSPVPVLVLVPAPDLASAAPPPPDRDGDGIADADDACPDEPGPGSNQGCPAGVKQRVIVSATKIEILDKVRFESGKAKLDRRSLPLLDQVAKVLESHADLTLVQVEGHTDDRGSALANLVLSQARAEAVAAYLESKGIASDRLRAKGFGSSQPVDKSGTAGGRAANRRVSFTVLRTRAHTIEAVRPRSS
jgi:outer membrane protein OmpA-like peptidoglycan-associated protein